MFPDLIMNNGRSIPALGFGTWRLTGQTCRIAVETALETGYRHIDTADVYENHQEVAFALKASGLARDQVFLTSKVWLDDIHREDLTSAAHRFLEELETGYLDLLLIHWPNRNIPIRESLEAMNSLIEEGAIRASGVSNFSIHHLQDALATGFSFSVNQVELHPSLSQPELVNFCRKNRIIVQAYSPMAMGHDLQLPLIEEIARKYDRPPAQIVLNWVLSKGLVALTRSGNTDHITSNFKALDWQLSPEDISRIDELDAGHRVIAPAYADFDY